MRKRDVVLDAIMGAIAFATLGLLFRHRCRPVRRASGGFICEVEGCGKKGAAYSDFGIGKREDDYVDVDNLRKRGLV